MDFFSAYDVDGDEAENGKWFELALGVEFKIRRSNSKKATEASVNAFKPYSTMKNMPEELSTKLLAEALSKGVIVDWRGLKKDGKEITPPEDLDKRAAMVQEWLSEYPELSVTIAALSGRMENFLKSQEDEQEKN